MCGYRTLTGARAPPTGPQAEGDVGPPFSGKRERAPALSLLPPWVLVRLSSSLGRLLKSIHPPFPSHCLARKSSRSGQQPAKTHRFLRTQPSNGLARQGKKQVRAAARKNPKALTHLSVQRPSPGRARLAEFRRPRPAEKFNHIFPGHVPGKIFLTPRVPASPARFGVHPPILGGASHQAGNLTPPYSAAPNEAQTPLAPPKIQYAKWFRS